MAQCSKKKKSLDAEVEADELAVKTLCQNGFKAIVKEEVNNLETKARESVKRWITQNNPTGNKIINSTGLVFAWDKENNFIGEIIGYTNCFNCGMKGWGCSKCNNATHPSLGRRYYLWKQLLEDCENQKN